MADAQPAASSAADTSPAAAAVLSDDFGAYDRAMTAADRGETISTPIPASSAAKPVEQAASTADTKVTEPAKPGHQGDADTRLRQVLADRHVERERADRLERELTELRSKSQPSDAKPAASSAAAATDDPEPNPDDLATYPNGQFELKFQKDLTAWASRQAVNAYKADELAREAAQKGVAEYAKRVEAHTQRMAAFSDKCEAAKTADPAAFDGIDPKLVELEPSINLKPGERHTFGHAIADAILESDHPVALLQHLSNKAEVQRLAALAPDAFYRAIGRIEAGFTTPAVAATAPAITEAPKPPTTFGRRPADPADAVEAALKDGDYARYEAAMNRRDFAARR